EQPEHLRHVRAIFLANLREAVLQIIIPVRQRQSALRQIIRVDRAVLLVWSDARIEYATNTAPMKICQQGEHILNALDLIDSFQVVRNRLEFQFLNSV